MKIEYVEESLDNVLKYFQKGYKSKVGPIRNFGRPIVDISSRTVVFKLYVDNKDEWDKKFHQKKA